ncbi:MAG: TraB/GumN family protein [Burkholderiaceae bacterium]
MRKYRISAFICATFTALLLPTVSLADTSLWRVYNNQTELFLGGTVHLLGKKDFPLPCEFDAAYRRAEKIVFEADIRNVQTPQFTRRYANQMLYPANQSLGKKLSKKTLGNLRKLLRNSGLPNQPYLQMKPGILMSTLVARQLQKSGITPGGVDSYYLDKASRDKVPLGFLETAESQMDLIVNMGVGNEDKFVQHIIENMAVLNKMFKKIVKNWRDGDIQALAEASELDEMRQSYPAIFDALIGKRNNNWMPQLTEMMKTPEVEYVLVGALHMAGDIGLLAQLRDAGYSVEAVNGCH